MHAKHILIGTIVLNSLLFVLFLLLRHYPPLLVSVHLLSLVVLWWLVFRKLPVTKLFARSDTDTVSKWGEVLLLLGLVALALWIRLYRVEEISPGMYGDELTMALNALDLLREAEWPPFLGAYSHPTPLMYLTAASITLFGHTMTAIRLTSILFGAGSVAAFYLLLRLFLPVPIAVAGGLFLVFQYAHVVLSRLAYEPIPSLFCQIVTAFFLALYARTKEQRYLIATALTLGAGLYTYYNFRTFALAVVALVLFLVLRNNWRRHWRQAALFSVMVFVAAMPLWSFAIIDPAGFWGRIATVSVFSQNYSTPELMKELGGNISRTALLPFIGRPGTQPPFLGDPNPGKNPAQTTMFNPITTILALVGFVYLFRKKRRLFWVAMLLYVPAFLSDILSAERIPDFHYYGLGHPNTLRVSGIIGIILFASAFGIWSLFTWVQKRNTRLSFLAVSVVVLLNSVANWLSYFNQENAAPVFIRYNYEYNHGAELQMIKQINSTRAQTITMTQPLSESSYVQFFLTPEKRVSSFTPESTASAMMTMQTNEITAFAVTPQTIPIINGLMKLQGLNIAGYTVIPIDDPDKRPKMVLFEKRSILPYQNLLQ